MRFLAKKSSQGDGNQGPLHAFEITLLHSVGTRLNSKDSNLHVCKGFVLNEAHAIVQGIVSESFTVDTSKIIP